MLSASRIKIKGYPPREVARNELAHSAYSFPSPTLPGHPPPGLESLGLPRAAEISWLLIPRPALRSVFHAFMHDEVTSHEECGWTSISQSHRQWRRMTATGTASGCAAGVPSGRFYSQRVGPWRHHRMGRDKRPPQTEQSWVEPPPIVGSHTPIATYASTNMSTETRRLQLLMWPVQEHRSACGRVIKELTIPATVILMAACHRPAIRSHHDRVSGMCCCMRAMSCPSTQL